MSDKVAEKLHNKVKKFIKQRDFNNALEILNKILELEPENAEAMSRLAYVHYRLNYKKIPKEEVFHISEKALELNPKSPITWHFMGIAYTEKNENDKAIECYRKAIEIDPNDADIWFNLGNRYADIGESDKAIECYRKASEIKPDFIKAWINLGLKYKDKGNLQKAMKCYKKAIKIDPDFALTWKKYF